jgi:hypothetical protein
VDSEVDNDGMVKAAYAANEPAIAIASGRPYEAEVALSAGVYGIELQRMGYTLSHVVHGYGAICQAITELALEKEVPITTGEFRHLNQCLDTAIAGAVTSFQAQRAEGQRPRNRAPDSWHMNFELLSIVNVSAAVDPGRNRGIWRQHGASVDRARSESMN